MLGAIHMDVHMYDGHLDDEETETMNCIYPAAQTQESLFSLAPFTLQSEPKMF